MAESLPNRSLVEVEQVEVRNTGARTAAETGSNLGWEHLRRRLELLYTEDGYRLAARQSAGWVTIAVELLLETFQP